MLIFVHVSLILIVVLRPAWAASEFGSHAEVSEYTHFLQTSSRKRMASSHQHAAQKPHILFVLLDDLGWEDVGFNRAAGKPSVTPTLDSLASAGIVLDRHYVAPLCSPTRSSIQSGRAPIHVNGFNRGSLSHNLDDPISGFAGIPPNMTGMAAVMRQAGYSTHMVGKWDVGMDSPFQTPAGKGYDTSLIYFGHEVDSWTLENHYKDQTCETDKGVQHLKDLWYSDADTGFPGRPAKLHKNVDDCNFQQQHPNGTCVYVDQIFEERAKNIIEAHDPSKPLFLFWATKTAHSSFQPPDHMSGKSGKLQNLTRASNRERRPFTISWIDGALGRVMQTLKGKNMYGNTLIVLTSDNGAEEKYSANYPLRGGKYTTWEGGVRVPAFVSGGFVPSSVRGTVQKNLVAAWDWYATFAGLVGANAIDAQAAQVGLPPLDSIDQWPLLSGMSSTALRKRVEIGGVLRVTGDLTAVGLITHPFKILIDGPAQKGVPRSEQACGRTPETGCLYDVFKDPGEQHNLAQLKPDIFRKLMEELRLVNRTVYSPNRGEPGRKSFVKSCNIFLSRYGGFFGPVL